MEYYIHILIIIHATTGGIALITGTLAGISMKGGSWHKKSGLLFYYNMLVSTLNGILVALLPGHYNPFLLAIGLFSIYLLLGGKRSLKFRNKNHNYLVDKLIASLMLVVGLLMIFVPIIIGNGVNIILLVFGVVGIIFSIIDLITFGNPTVARKKWLIQHIGKMSGAYIASLSAFLVVNNFFPPLVNWFGPSVLGAIFIAFYMIRIKRVKFVLTR